MGLDMYLNKAKRIDDASVRDILNINGYLQYHNEDHKGYSLKEWIGIDESDVDTELADKYKTEFTTRYWAWDNEKKYGHLSVVEPVGYWRKANHIHKWFVDCIQDGEDDCGCYEVPKADIEQLLYLCKQVLEHSKLVKGKIKNGYRFVNGKEEAIMEDGEYIEDPTVAQELLPTSSGFFFGSYEYDQWYLNDIKETIIILETVLENTDFDSEVVYYSSSW